MNDFVLANSAVHDEIQPYAAFHLNLQSLPRYPLWGFAGEERAGCFTSMSS